MKIKSDGSEVLKLRERYDRIEPFILRKLEGLPKYLSYHNIDHTREVIDSAVRIAVVGGLRVWNPEYWLVKTGVLLHDTGYLFQPIGKGHEERGADFAERLLENYNYKLSDIMAISGMIRATTIPQNPRTFLEGIVCDADVDNFGRDDFFDKGKLLRQELESMGIKMPDKQWYEGTLKLLESHKYNTNAAKYLRDNKKKDNIEELKRRIASLG